MRLDADEFSLSRCQALADIKDNDEKDSAFRGICSAIQANPNGISSAFGYFLNAVARWNRPSEQLNDMFRTVSPIVSFFELDIHVLTHICVSIDSCRVQGHVGRTRLGCAARSPSTGDRHPPSRAVRRLDKSLRRASSATRG